MDAIERYKLSIVNWNNIVNNNTEDKVVSSWYMSSNEGSVILDKFSIWLLVGTGATASLFITQIKDILHYLTHDGFIVGMILLVLSSISGILAKFYAINNAILSKIQQNLTQNTNEIYESHRIEVEKILSHLEGLKKQGIELELEALSMDKIINTFLKPFPYVTKKIIKKSLITNEKLGVKAAGFLANMAYVHQSWFTIFQTVLFILFIVSAAWFSVNNI